MPELKSCMRCKSEAVRICPSLANTYWPECTACGCQGPTFPTQEEAAAWWNERKAEQPEAAPMPGSVQPEREPETHSAERAPEAEPTHHAKDDIEERLARLAHLIACAKTIQNERLDALDNRCGELWKCVNALEAAARKPEVELFTDNVRHLDDEPTHAAKDEPPPWYCHECGKPQWGRDFFGHVCDTCHSAAKDEPPHVCPYGGIMHDSHGVGGLVECGKYGWLCHRCREDRADERFDALIAAFSTVTAMMAKMSNRADSRMDNLCQTVGILIARQEVAICTMQQMTRALARAIITSTAATEEDVAKADLILDEEGLRK